MTNSITCSKCGNIINLDQALADQVKKAELDLKKQYEAKNEALEKQVEERVQKEKLQMWEKAQEAAAKKAEEKYSLDLKDLKEQAKEKDEQLKKAQEQELELRKKSRELEEREKNMNLEMERKMDEEKKKIEIKAKESLDEEYRKKLNEKDQQVEQFKKTIDELKRKSEQNSMQLQGDAQENDLKHLLERYFPFDVVEDVATGIRGADLIQRVRNNIGQECGILLWESKNTRIWNGAWVKKLKDDQANAKADVAIIATTAMPEGITNFGLIDGVWVVEYRFVQAFTQTLRYHVLALSNMQNSVENRDEKMSHLYTYLTGPQFKNRIENIVSAFTSMKDQLDAEKRAMMRLWSKREQEIDRVTNNTIGLYGDMQGIVALPTIQALELPEGLED